MHYVSRERVGMPGPVAFLLQPGLYRGVIAAALAFVVVVAAAAWVLHGTGAVRRPLLALPPGATYHVGVTGEVVPIGGTQPSGGSKPAPAASAHAALLDHAYHITAEFGHYPDGSAHYGIDVDAWTGTVVHAPVAGTVTEVLRGCVVGDEAGGKGWGNHVWFKSAETGDYALLAHFSQLSEWVQVGATFDAGAPFGLSGSTGYSSGPHVHIQVNPQQMGNPGSTNPAWEFPWLRCGDPVWGALFGAPCR